jgi:hypothetical protein
LPFDRANGLEADRRSAGRRPLVRLAGVLESFREGADAIRRRFAGIRLCAAPVRRARREAGPARAARPRGGDLVQPAPLRPGDFARAGPRQTAAYLGLGAFSGPMQPPGGGKAEGRMLSTAIRYAPDQSPSSYLVDFERDQRAAPMGPAAIAPGLGAADPVIALSDAGDGREPALRRHFGDDLRCIRDWSHASQHPQSYARCLRPKGAAQARAWAAEAKGVLSEQGGSALLAHLRAQPVPGEADVADERRKLLDSVADNEHRTGYPESRRHGGAIGSGPTAAAGKVVGAGRKGSGLRGVEAGAARIAPLRALARSGPEVGDAFGARAA